MKTTEEVYKEHGFTDEMMLPEHLVKMLMHQYAKQFMRLCDGCNVRDGHEHRCHGTNCQCDLLTCKEQQR